MTWSVATPREWWFLFGVLTGVALTLLVGARWGMWVCLDEERAESGCGADECQAPTRRFGFVPAFDVTWRPWFRCAYCDARWVRGYVHRAFPRWLVERIRTHDAYDGEWGPKGDVELHPAPQPREDLA